MKKWMFLIALTIASCDPKGQVQDGDGPSAQPSAAWTTYEGRVPLDDKRSLYIEVSLRANEDGDGDFQLREYLEDGNTTTVISDFEGYYTSLHGQTPDARIIQFHHTALADAGLERTYLAPASKNSVLRQERFRTKDLTVRISAEHKLIVLDNHMKTITEEPEYNLAKRLARPFTIEGYFRHNGYSADFFEINTGQNWTVTKYGDYEKAIRQYYELTENKFDVAYLKGIGFPVRQESENGREREALVIKKVLQMTSLPGLHQESSD